MERIGVAVKISATIHLGQRRRLSVPWSRNAKTLTCAESLIFSLKSGGRWRGLLRGFAFDAEVEAEAFGGFA